MFMCGSIATMLTSTKPDSKIFAAAFVFLAIAMTTALWILVPMIIKDKRTPLIFTELGIVGTAFFNVKYEDIRSYGWENCDQSLALGQETRHTKVTLALTSNKGLFPELSYKNRFGGSVLGVYCYFFSPSQIEKVETIFKTHGIKSAG